MYLQHCSLRSICTLGGQRDLEQVAGLSTVCGVDCSVRLRTIFQGCIVASVLTHHLMISDHHKICNEHNLIIHSNNIQLRR